MAAKPKTKTAVRARNEGSVFFHKASGTWRAQIRLEDGKYATRTAKTEADAAKLLHQLRTEQESGTVVRGDLTVADLLDEWVKLDLHTFKYVDGGAASLSHIAAWRSALGKAKVSRLGVIDIEAAMRKMKRPNGKPYAWETMNKRRSVLNQVFEAAIRRNRTKTNPAPLARFPENVTETAERRAFSVEQAQAIIAATEKHRNGAAYLIGLSLGLRPGEIFGLRWDSIDFRRKTIHVQHGVRMSTGSPVLVDDLKTSGALRTLGAPDFVLDALRTHRDRQDAEIKPEGYEDQGLVFPDDLGGPVDLHVFRDWFRMTIKALGFGDDWTTNEMRHTAASILSANGVHLRDIADILGHSTTKMLEKHYRHGMQPEKTAHVETMGALFGGGSKRRKRTG